MNDYKKVKIILTAIFFINIGVAISKLLVGIYINSSSVVADGMHSLSDSLSNLVGLIGIVIASRPSDVTHPYGHNKFEVLASLFIGVMLVFISFEIISKALFYEGAPSVNITFESLLILVITTVVNIFIASYEYRAGKNLNSSILISDSIHTRSDIFISIGVLITLFLIKLGVPATIDRVISLLVSLVILHSAYEVFKSSISVLVDKAVVSEADIRLILEEFADIKDIHKIRSRGSRQSIYIDMHIMVNPDMTIETAHNLNHDLENKIKEKIDKSAQVIVHLEPYYDKEQ